MSDAATTKQIVGGAYEAIVKGDVGGFLSVFDPEITISEPACLPYGGEFHGFDEIKGMFMKAAPYLDSGRMVVEDIVAEEDRAVAILRIPTRDGSGEAVMAEYWRLRDGKAVELRVLWADPTIVTATV
jgi:ketosteroid isomerase-like protein